MKRSLNLLTNCSSLFRPCGIIIPIILNSVLLKICICEFQFDTGTTLSLCIIHVDREKGASQSSEPVCPEPRDLRPPDLRALPPAHPAAVPAHRAVAPGGGRLQDCPRYPG